MTKIKAVYTGDLSVECEHLQSGTKIITDAPVDHNGKGSSFSPTDLCATALGACMLTTMGIYTERNGIDIKGATAEIDKIMSEGTPRKIAKLEVNVTMPNKPYSSKEKLVIERTAQTCAVHNTLEGAVQMDITIKWAD